jgi:hypothetical protein
VGERRQCQWPQCPGEQVLTEKPTRVRPKQLAAGETFPQTHQRFNVWICTDDTREHVEVQGWGLRPTQDCTFEGCKGVMVHYFAAREIPSPGSEQPVRKGNFGRLEPQGGWLCIGNPVGHFTPDEG